MIDHAKSPLADESLFHRIQEIFLELFHPPTAQTNHVMMAVDIRRVPIDFIAGPSIVEMDLLENLQLCEKLQRTVHGGHANVLEVLPHKLMHFFRRQMLAWSFQEYLDDPFALRREAPPPVFQPPIYG